MADNKDELVVIKRSDLNQLLDLIEFRMIDEAFPEAIVPTFPASEVFIAAKAKTQKVYREGTFPVDKYPTYTDYEQTKL